MHPYFFLKILLNAVSPLYFIKKIRYNYLDYGYLLERGKLCKAQI